MGAFIDGAIRIALFGYTTDNIVTHVDYIKIATGLYIPTPEANPYPTYLLNKNRISGYHCFVDQYTRAKRTGYDPLKLPDGTLF